MSRIITYNAVEIVVVENGYEVRIGRIQQCLPTTVFVFESFVSMTDWLDDNLTPPEE